MTLRVLSKPLQALVFCLVALAASSSIVTAQTAIVAQAPVWIGKPDIAAFEKLENDRLAAAQRAIEQILTVKGGRTIENTLVPYDEIVRQYNSANNLAVLLLQVHPDA